MDPKQKAKIYLRSYWLIILVLLVALVAFNTFAKWAHTGTITPQEAYDHILNQNLGDANLAEYVRNRCEIHGCKIGTDGHVIVRDP